MGSKEQTKPLAPAAAAQAQAQVDIPEDGDLSREMKKRRRRKCLKCCGCVSAVFLILAVIIIILALTVFQAKDPVIRMNYVTVQGLEVLTRANTFRPGVNLTIEADISVKNPNAASFKFRNATTSVFYDGVEIGEATNPSGNARARRTLRMNVSVKVMVDKIMGVPRLMNDLAQQRLPVSSHTNIRGRVKILNIIKKSVTVKMNCTIVIDIRTQSVQDMDCKRKVSM